MGALSVGDVRTGTIPSLLPSQKHYLKVYSLHILCITVAQADVRLSYSLGSGQMIAHLVSKFHFLRNNTSTVVMVFTQSTTQGEITGIPFLLAGD
ncbi:MAG: hypothetical protein V1736_07505 [Pseudomonadota bacterium]